MCYNHELPVLVEVNNYFFLFQLIFIFPFYRGMVMCANEFKTQKKQNLIKLIN